MTQRRHGTMATERAARYAKQLGGHWGRKGSVLEQDGATVITFHSGQVVTMTPEPATLWIEVSVPEDMDVDRFAAVVADHLVRFGSRDELVVEWEPAPQA